MAQMDWRHSTFSLAFRAMAATGASTWAAPIARGRGIIFTLHRVCAHTTEEFAPNRILDITPGFLDAALAHIRSRGIDLVDMDEAVRRIVSPDKERFFAALTFDDGFADVAKQALPILRRHHAPACIYVVPGFATRTAPLWWTLKKASGNWMMSRSRSVVRRGTGALAQSSRNARHLTRFTGSCGRCPKPICAPPLLSWLQKPGMTARGLLNSFVLIGMASGRWQTIR
jgi:hypothetical protein